MSNLNSVEFSSRGESIEFSAGICDVIVTIENFDAYSDCVARCSLSRDNLCKLIPKLESMLSQLEQDK